MSCFKIWLSIIIIYVAAQQKEIGINKCCYEGEQLDSDFKTCVLINGSRISKEVRKTFYGGINNNTMNWIPEEYRKNTFTVMYSMLHNVKYDIINVYSLEKRIFVTKEDYGGFVIKNERYCVDIANSVIYSRVLVTVMQILNIQKCCQKYEQLNADANACIIIPGKEQENIEQETINYIPSSNKQPWYINGNSKFKLTYNFLYSGYNFNNIIRYPTGLQKLRIDGDLFVNSTAFFIGEDQNGSIIEGATDAFCFDSIKEGILAHNAILVALYDIYKCCPKGKYMNIAVNKCLSRPGIKLEDTKNEIVHWNENDYTKYWIPNFLRTSPVSVRYNTFEALPISFQRIFNKIVVYNEDIWKLRKNKNGILILAGSIPLLSGLYLNYETQNFCFETIEGNEQVIFLQDFPKFEVPSKCCFPGKAFSVDGICEKHDMTDWSPSLADSRMSKFSPLIPNSSINLPLQAFCHNSRFRMLSSWTSISSGEYKMEIVSNDPFTWTGYCVDFRISSGIQEQVVASCTILSIGKTYKFIRPLGVVSATLFLAAAVVAMVRKDTRSSAHGRALVAHALCLSAASAFQVTWFFNVKKYDPYCPLYAYLTYLFMTAANWWLTAITINMMKNFRRPLGALARGAGGGTSPRAVWRRFGIMSAFAWGGSTTLTILSITMHQYRKEITEQGLIPPSFFETRTCGLEFNEVFREQAIGEHLFSNRLGSVFYYYMPASLLVAINAVCMVLTSRRMMKLKKDSAFAHGSDLSNNIKQRHLKNVSLYVKLMLTTGIMELLLEAVAWSLARQLTIQNKAHDVFNTKENSFVFGIFSMIIDFLRAFCMFWLCMGPWCDLSTGRQRCVKAMGDLWDQMVKWMRNLLALMRRVCGSEQQQNQEVSLDIMSDAT